MKYPPSMPPSVAAQIADKLREAQALAAPYEWSLTPEERRGGAKMGPDSVSFVQSAIDALLAQPNVMARNFEDDIIGETFTGNRTLGPLENAAQSLSLALEEAETQLGAVAYNQALQIYQAFQIAVKGDDSLRPYVDEMAQRFEKQSGPRTPKPPTPPATPSTNS